MYEYIRQVTNTTLRADCISTQYVLTWADCNTGYSQIQLTFNRHTCMQKYSLLLIMIDSINQQTEIIALETHHQFMAGLY